MPTLEEQADKLIDLINSSEFAVAFTGAGISTESGIPDYRSPGTGLWEKMDQSVVSLGGFLNKPSSYYDYAAELYSVRSAAKPNPAHFLLAALEEKGVLKGVITQNVDGLHHEAGSGQVHELHGSLRQVVCLECAELEPMETAMERVFSGQNPPLCLSCGGVLKPNAVFFGESLPHVPWESSVDLARSSDLFITIGSSLQVSPASHLPDMAVRAGAKLVIMNLMPTPFDSEAALLIREKIGEFSSIVTELLIA